MRTPGRSAIPDAGWRACHARSMPGRCRPPARQRGTTLVELVIAMAVALMVLGTVGLIFGGTSRNRASLERAARLTENANYALDVIRNDVAQAGYYDTLTTTAGGFTWQLRDPCVTALADLGWSNPIGTPPPVNAKLENAPVPIFGIRAADPTPSLKRARRDRAARPSQRNSFGVSTGAPCDRVHQ